MLYFNPSFYDIISNTERENFLINNGEASAAHLEALGLEVAKRVKNSCGISLQWEIIRLGNEVGETPPNCQEGLKIDN